MTTLSLIESELAALMAAQTNGTAKAPIAPARAQATLEIALWPNTKMRDGKQDSQFQGQAKVLRKQMIADLEASGEEFVSFYLNVWANAASTSESGKPRPILSGRGSNLVVRTATSAIGEDSPLVQALRAIAAK